MSNTIGGPKPTTIPATSTPPDTTPAKPVDDRVTTSVTGGSENATISVSAPIGNDAQVKGLADFDTEGLRRAHVSMEKFFGGADGQTYRLSAKVGTSQMSNELEGSSVMAKVQLDKKPTQLVGDLNHSFSIKAGEFHIPNTGSVRAGLAPESVDLIGVGGKYELQLDTAIGGEKGVKVTGNYGVAADFFVEPFPSAKSREEFTSGTGFSGFDIGKTAGFSDLSAYAQTRASYQIGDKGELHAEHNLRYSADDPTVKSVIDDHSLSAGGTLALYGRHLKGGAEVRVPIESRTARPGEAADAVTTRLDLTYRPKENIEVNAYATLRGTQMGEAGVRADVAINENLRAGGFARHDFQSGESVAGVGLSWSFGGPKKSSARREPSRAYESQLNTSGPVATRSDRSDAMVNRPPARNLTPASVGGFPSLTGKSYDEAMPLINTPEKAAALLAPRAYFTYGFHDENVKYSPRESYARKTGVVCAEQHAVQAQALKHNGYTAHNVEFMSNSVAHVVTAYQDKASGKWNIMDYNTIHETQADTIQKAMERYEPGYYEYKVIDYSDTTDRTERPTTREVDRAAVVREVQNFWNND